VNAEIVIANATELKPDRKYLIVLDRRAITEEDAHKLMKGLAKIGITNSVGVAVLGDAAQAVKIIEQKETQE
jgi:hypothetical protein